MIAAMTIADAPEGRALPRLPGRLRRLLEMLPPPSRAVADVGAGHGYLAIALAARGWPRVIATEAGAGPLAELRANVAAWRVEARVEVRGGAALTPLEPDEVDGVVVAGMGAHTMIGICEQAAGRRVGWMALQCVQRPHLVAQWLQEHGWRVLTTAEPTDRGRIYPTWVVEVHR